MKEHFEDIDELYEAVMKMWYTIPELRIAFNNSDLKISAVDRVEINDEFRRSDARLESFISKLEDIADGQA